MESYRIIMVRFAMMVTRRKATAVVVPAKSKKDGNADLMLQERVCA